MLGPRWVTGFRVRVQGEFCNTRRSRVASSCFATLRVEPVANDESAEENCIIETCLHFDVGNTPSSGQLTVSSNEKLTNVRQSRGSERPRAIREIDLVDRHRFFCYLWLRRMTMLENSDRRGELFCVLWTFT